jgi:hypothetical protein
MYRTGRARASAEAGSLHLVGAWPSPRRPGTAAAQFAGGDAASSMLWLIQVATRSAVSAGVSWLVP